VISCWKKEFMRLSSEIFATKASDETYEKEQRRNFFNIKKI